MNFYELRKRLPTKEKLNKIAAIQDKYSINAGSQDIVEGADNLEELLLLLSALGSQSKAPVLEQAIIEKLGENKLF